MTPPVPVLLAVRELGQGGCERDLTKLATGLDRSRFTPHVACFRPDGIRRSDLEAAGVPILHLPVGSFQSFSAIRGGQILGGYLRQHKIQALQAFDVPLSIFATPVARLAGTPAIFTSQLSYRTLVEPLYRRLLRVSDRLTDAVIVNCKAMEKHMVHDERLAAARTRLCYNGIDTDVFHPDGRQRTPALANSGVTIGCVCALRPEKDLPTLLRAFALLRSSIPGGQLVLVGSGPLLPDLQALAAELNISSACHFEPALPNVAPWLRAIDIFVLPSVSEAFSNALMEAMACGCAPVASAVGGNGELVMEGRTGLLFTAGNHTQLAAALQKLALDENLRSTCARNSASFIRENFSLATYTHRMEEIFSEFLAARGTNRYSRAAS